MSHDPTMEPTVLDEVNYMMKAILLNMDVEVSERVQLELSEHVDMVVNSSDRLNSDRLNNVPTREYVLFMMVEKLLQIGEFTTNQDLEEMNKYYNK